MVAALASSTAFCAADLAFALVELLELMEEGVRKEVCDSTLLIESCGRICSLCPNMGGDFGWLIHELISSSSSDTVSNTEL